ncbi:MAG: flagellar hook-associated protein FlgL [Firmicutes bacterium]|nr:flagellar hook-associated protein FlgL [Bacillota bacterium]
MRITNSMLSATFMRDLNQNLRNLARKQHQLATGRLISRPSDDPVGIVHSLRLRSELADIERYGKNVDHALAWLSTTETGLSQTCELLQRARELAVYGANSTLPQESLDALAKEVDQLLEQMVQVANTSYAGQHVFAGTNTKTPPFTATGDYQGNGQAKETEVGAGLNFAYNLDGETVFKQPDAFKALQDLRAHLLSGDTGQISGSDIGAIEGSIDHVLSLLAEVGARVNRLELTKARLEQANIDFTSLLSKVEDVDVAAAIMELMNHEHVYQVALATGARIIQPSLVDFLR